MVAAPMRKLRLLPAMLALAAVVAPCFVAAPGKKSEVSVAPVAGMGMALLANIEAASAALPPLEDVPLEEIGQTRQGMLDKESDTFMGSPDADVCTAGCRSLTVFRFQNQIHVVCALIRD